MRATTEVTMLHGLERAFTNAGAELLRRYAADTDGATAIEYALIAGGIGVVIVTGIEAVGISLNAVFNSIVPLFS